MIKSRFRPTSLRAKLSLLFVGLLAFATAVHVYVFYRLSRDLNHITLQRLYSDTAPAIAARLQPLLDRGAGHDEILRLGSQIAELSPSVAVYVLNAEGRCLFGISPFDGSCIEPVEPSILELSLRVPSEGGILLSRGRVFTAARLQLEGKPAYLLLLPDGSSQYDSARSVSRENALILQGAAIAVGVSLFSVVVSLGCLFLLSRRFRVLITAVRRFHAGEFRERVDLAGTDELAELAGTFNQMAEKIAQQIESLNERDAHRRRLISDISHDLRTPLTVLRMNATQMHSIAETSEPAVQCRNSIERNTKMLEQLLGDLFELSKLEARQVSPQTVACSVEEIFDDVSGTLSSQANEKRILIEKQVAEDLPFVLCDPAMILRVIGNLLENSIRYTPEGGRARLSATRTLRGVRIAVSDTGVGIGEDEMPKIFDRYYRGNESRKPVEGSTGLGLAIVKQLVELHGSTIELKSAPDAGTEFSFTLQIAGE